MADAVQTLITELLEFVESAKAQPVKVTIATMVAAFQEIETAITPVTTVVTKNEVYAGPTTGAAALPTFRLLVPADLPIATTSLLGAVKPDGTTITVNISGVISAAAGGGPFLPLAGGTMTGTEVFADAGSWGSSGATMLSTLTATAANFSASGTIATFVSSSNNAQVAVFSSPTSPALVIKRADTSTPTGQLIFAGNGGGDTYSLSSNQIVGPGLEFNKNSSNLGIWTAAAMTISTPLFVGATAQLSETARQLIAFTGSTTNGLNINDSSSTNTAIFAGFYTNGAREGSITNNNNAGVLYNVTCDKTLKWDLGLYEPGDLFDRPSLQVHLTGRRGNYEAGERAAFFAQDLYVDFPQIVTPGKSGGPWQLDNSALVPYLTAEIISHRKALKRAGLLAA